MRQTAWSLSYLKSALFWDVMQRRVVIPYRRFETINRSNLQGSRIQESS